MICCQLVEWTLFLSFFLDSGIYNYIMDHLVSVKLNLVVNTLEWLLKAWSDIATCGLDGIHRLWLEGMEGGSHHITEEELWLEQKALREGGHITREELVIHVYGGHARLFSLLDFIWTLRKGSIKYFRTHIWHWGGIFVSSVREGVKKADILRSGWP